MADRLSKYRVVQEDGCHTLTKTLNSNGYYQITINYTMYSAHRIAYEDAHGEIPEGLMVLHSCGNRGCVNPEHLRVGTHQENMDDRDLHGTTARGERHGSAKLTEKEVKEILQLLSEGVGSASIGRLYNVSKHCILHIKWGTKWKHVPREEQT